MRLGPAQLLLVALLPFLPPLINSSEAHVGVATPATPDAVVPHVRGGALPGVDASTVSGYDLLENMPTVATLNGLPASSVEDSYSDESYELSSATDHFAGFQHSTELPQARKENLTVGNLKATPQYKSKNLTVGYLTAARGDMQDRQGLAVSGALTLALDEVWESQVL